MARLGTGGCGYEHPLLSLYFAVSQSDPSSRDFFRDDAVLGIIMLTDEDDCSADPTRANFFEGAVPGQSGSLRCSLRGHVCGGQPVPAMPFMAPLSSCKPYEVPDGPDDGSRLLNVSFFGERIKGMKRGRADRLFVASIMGWDATPDATYRIVERPVGMTSELDTGDICSNPMRGRAAPGIRLHAFTRAFANNAIYSICAPDLGANLQDIGTKLSSLLAPP